MKKNRKIPHYHLQALAWGTLAVLSTVSMFVRLL